MMRIIVSSESSHSLHLLFFSVLSISHSLHLLFFSVLSISHSLHLLFFSVLSISHSLHLLFCCVLSILALIWLVLTALFCATIRRESVSLLKFPFFQPSPLLVFFTRVFHWSLGDSKSLQISRTLHSIPADLSSAVVCKILILLVISNSSSLFFFWAFQNRSKHTDYIWYQSLSYSTLFTAL